MLKIKILTNVIQFQNGEYTILAQLLHLKKQQHNIHNEGAY